MLASHSLKFAVVAYPKTPRIQIAPTSGLKSINSAYFGLFGVSGFGFDM